MNSTSQHFQRIHNIIVESDKQSLLVEFKDLSGLSGHKLVGTLQRLARYQESINGGCCLEIGVFQGLTLISVAGALTETLAYGVDNFTQVDPEGKNQEIIRRRLEVNNINNACIINKDYEVALEDLGQFVGDNKIGVLFIDGPHDYRSQLICLQLSKKYLSESAIIVIDDSNYRHVRLANRDFLLSNPDFKLLFETYTSCHPENMTKEGKEEATKGWWNGVNILVRDPADILDRMYPPTLRDRTLYENEHVVHAAEYGYLAPEAVSFVTSVLHLRFLKAAKQLVRTALKYRKANSDLKGRYFSMNTFSEELPERFNPSFRNESE